MEIPDQAGLRQGDTVARIAGDEFALMLPDLADQEAAMVVANKIIARLQEPLQLDTRERQMRASLMVRPRHLSPHELPATVCDSGDFDA